MQISVGFYSQPQHLRRYDVMGERKERRPQVGEAKFRTDAKMIGLKPPDGVVQPVREMLAELSRGLPEASSGVFHSARVKW